MHAFAMARVSSKLSQSMASKVTIPMAQFGCFGDGNKVNRWLESVSYTQFQTPSLMQDIWQPGSERLQASVDRLFPELLRDGSSQCRIFRERGGAEAAHGPNRQSIANSGCTRSRAVIASCGLFPVQAAYCHNRRYITNSLHVCACHQYTAVQAASCSNR